VEAIGTVQDALHSGELKIPLNRISVMLFY
jgi:hypothetical protein